jgi:catecholate siderophore receptor
MISVNFCGRKAALMASTALALALSASAAAAQTNSAVQLGTVRIEGEGAADANPYADPDAPYKADRLSSGKFSEPVVNTPRSETIITKEALDDTNRTSFRDVARSTAGVTLGTGEGGNSFGDRFFIRGVDARNDIFIDGVRDPGVLMRENFNVEQIEILKGPSSSVAGRGTAGGAVNLVTKQARPGSFYDFEATGGPIDDTLRLTADVNQELTDTLSVRFNAMIQNAKVAGRDFTSDNRWGLAGAVTWTPLENLTITGDYSYTFMYGLPDFGVPYNPLARRPVTSGDVPRETYYGAVNRDFIRSVQGQGGVNIRWAATDWLTLENSFHTSHSLLHYIGTIPENPSATGATAPFSSNAGKFSGYTQLNAQSRYEPVTVLVDQPQATFYFETGAIKHTAVMGGEFSSERVSFGGYTGLTSELTTGATAFTSSGAAIVPVGSPTNIILSKSTPVLTTNPIRYKIDTNAGFIMDTANYNDLFILNAAIRFDDYKINSANNTASQSANSGITSYNIGLVVKPVDYVSVYAAFGTAAEPVGAEVDGNSSTYGGLAPTQPTTQIFGPQKSKAYEVGVKWELFDGNLLATAAFFQTDISNARETAPAGLPGYTSGQIVGNAAYNIRGYDFGLTGNITDAWSIQAGLVLMNPEVTNSIVPANIGLQLANIASESFNLLTKYTVTDWLAVGAQAVYTSEIQGGTLLAANGGVAYPGTPYPTRIPAWWRGDMFVEGIVTENILLRLNVQNIFDKTYYDSLYQSAVPFVKVAPGRSVTLSAEVKF